jgi:uncharacterized protein YoxC
MALITQICIVAVTIALVAMAVMVIRLLIKTSTLIENANRSLAELPALIEEVRQISARADDLLIAFSQISGSARAAAAQFENLATRSGALASALIDELDRPVSKAVGLMRGIRVGASFLVQRWWSHIDGNSNTNQGDEHDREQRWLDDGGIPDRSAGRSRAGSALRANGR